MSSSCASSSTWTWAAPTAGGRTRSSRCQEILAPHRRRTAPDRRCRRTIPGERRDAVSGTGRGEEIGVIASVTQPFCGTCTRARLTAEGRFLHLPLRRSRPRLRALPCGGATDVQLSERFERGTCVPIGTPNSDPRQRFPCPRWRCPTSGAKNARRFGVLGLQGCCRPPGDAMLVGNPRPFDSTVDVGALRAGATSLRREWVCRKRVSRAARRSRRNAVPPAAPGTASPPSSAVDPAAAVMPPLVGSAPGVQSADATDERHVRQDHGPDPRCRACRVLLRGRAQPDHRPDHRRDHPGHRQPDPPDDHLRDLRG